LWRTYSLGPSGRARSLTSDARQTPFGPISPGDRSPARFDASTVTAVSLQVTIVPGTEGGVAFHFRSGWLAYIPLWAESRDMFERLHRALSRQSRSVEYGECRQCGTAVDASTRCCPDCGSAEIASYTF